MLDGGSEVARCRRISFHGLIDVYRVYRIIETRRVGERMEIEQLVATVRDIDNERSLAELLTATHDLLSYIKVVYIRTGCHTESCKYRTTHDMFTEKKPAVDRCKRSNTDKRTDG